MSLYVTVLLTALIVSLLGLTGLTVVRIERRQTSVMNDRLVARANARSAVELALVAIADDADWRNKFNNGQETVPLTLGDSDSGTVSWIVEDTDGDLTDSDTLLRLKGVGRMGTATQVSSIIIEQAVRVPQELRSQTGSQWWQFFLLYLGELRRDNWWGQYLKVNLPPDATGWRVTSIELYCRKGDGNRDFNVRIREPDASHMPSANIHDSVDLNSNDFADALGWQAITFSGDYKIPASEGICITIETTERRGRVPIELAFLLGGVYEPDSALIRGDPTWNSYDTDKALLYRVHGVYWSNTNEIQPIPGTWLCEPAP